MSGFWPLHALPLHFEPNIGIVDDPDATLGVFVCGIDIGYRKHRELAQPKTRISKKMSVGGQVWISLVNPLQLLGGERDLLIGIGTAISRDYQIRRWRSVTKIPVHPFFYTASSCGAI